MKVVFLLVALAAACLAAPQSSQPVAYILEQTIDNDGLGAYTFGFKSSDGQIRQENGVVKNQGTDNEIMESRGTITWIDADGKERTLTFVANEDGFQPVFTR